MKAAEQGEATAQCNLGNMYNDGKGIEKNYGKALEWYRKAAEQGLANAQFNLGRTYEQEGNGKVAKEWYLKAAEQEDSDALYQLGLMYLRGKKGVEKNEKEAFDWFLKAAKKKEIRLRNSPLQVSMTTEWEGSKKILGMRLNGMQRQRRKATWMRNLIWGVAGLMDREWLRIQQRVFTGLRRQLGAGIMKL